MNKKSNLGYLTVLIILFPITIWAQVNSFKTSFKTTAEVGLVDVELIGEGILQRTMFKIDSKRKFESSLLDIKLNIRSEFYGLENSLGAAKVVGQADYIISMNKNNLLSFSLLSDNNYVDVFEKYNQKLYHLVAKSKFVHSISNIYAIQISGKNSHSQLIYNEDGYLRLNSVDGGFIYNKESFGKISFGVFVTDLSLLQNEENVKRLRYGIDTEYNYRDQMIFGITIRLFKYYKYDLINQQVKFIAGKYFLKDLSMFMMANIIRSGSDTNNDAYALLVNRMENYNSASLKLGYDFSQAILFYIKALYQDQNILESDFVIASGQVLLGTQYKF